MKRPIAIKLGAVIGILLSLILVVGLTAFFQAHYISEKVKEITEVEHKTSETAYQMEISLMETGAAVLKYLQDGDSGHIAVVKRGNEGFQKFQDEYVNVTPTRQTKDLGTKVEQAHRVFSALAESLIEVKKEQSRMIERVNNEFKRCSQILEEETYQPEKRFDAHKDAKMRASLRVQAMKVNISQMKNDLENYLKTHLPEYMTGMSNDKVDWMKNLRLQQEVARPERKEKFGRDMKFWFKNITGLIDSIVLSETAQREMLSSFEKNQKELSSLLEEQVLILANKNLLAAKDEALRVAERSNMVITSLLAITLLFGSGMGVLFAQSITKPLKKLVNAADTIATNDLSHRVIIRSGDELEVLANSFNHMTSELQAARKKQADLLSKIEKSNKELEAFAYVVSHDLKAPLRGIHTVSEWMATGLADRIGEEGVSQLGLVRNRVKRMFDMIDGILKYSKVGKTGGEKEKIEMNQFTKDIVQFISVPKHIEVIVRKNLPAVYFERVRLHQVLQNLLSNAVKYMDKENGRIEVGCKDVGDFWQFSVSDNGPGIEARFLEKIFLLFQTIQPKDERESTGVGLAIVQKIVESEHGRVWVESQVGEGSTFFFTLPKNNEEKSVT